MLSLGAGPDQWQVPAAEATHIGCGQTLGPGGSFTLDSPLTGCSGTALVVTSAELNLNGHTVSCSSGNGIRLEGAGSRVTNGAVTGCGFGVDVAGDGGHHVEKVAATDNTIGFVVTTGSDNTLHANTAAEGDYGFVVQVGNNRLSANTASGNIVSFVVNAGTNNDLSDNVARESALGFQVSSSSTALSGNTATGNRTGFVIPAGGNDLTDNIATGNASGITVQSGAQGNRLRSNAASGNTGVDLVDENASCGGNEWQANTFGVANEACIR
jgi:parallel beta-helix repeat protein